MSRLCGSPPLPIDAFNNVICSLYYMLLVATRLQHSSGFCAMPETISLPSETLAMPVCYYYMHGGLGPC